MADPQHNVVFEGVESNGRSDYTTEATGETDMVDGALGGVDVGRNVDAPAQGSSHEVTAGRVSDRLGSSRRQFLRRVGGGVAVGAASTLAGCEHDTGVNPTPNDSGGLPTRKSISSLRQSDPNNILGTFEDAVRMMKNRSDKRSWQNIARIHGDARNYIHCRHGNWLFLPWHRAYLAFFEDICRELTGNEEFALPFWNWAANPQVPSMFTNSSSQLHNSTRSANPHPNGPDTDQSELQSVLNEGNFLRFAGRSSRGKGDLENPPHDTVHLDVGGDPRRRSTVGHMSQANSPRDPLFWVHHCMVDCIWWEWNWGQLNPNTNDSTWTNASFQNEFVDRNGNDVSSISVQDTLFIPLESHGQYDVTNKGTGGTAATPSAETETRRQFIEQGAEVDLETVLNVPVSRELAVPPGEFLEVEIGTEALRDIRPFVIGEQQGRLDLAFRDIQLPALSGARTRVFVDQPEPLIDAPREDPRYAGSIVFFKGAETEGPYTMFVNVTDVLRRIADVEEDLFDRDELRFQLVSPSPEGQPAEEFEQQTYVIDTLDLEVTQSFVGDHPLKTDEQSG